MNKPVKSFDNSPYVVYKFESTLPAQSELFMLNLADTHIVKGVVRSQDQFYWVMSEIEEAEIDALLEDFDKVYQAYAKTMPEWYTEGREVLKYQRRSWIYKHWKVGYKFKVPNGHWFKNKNCEVYPDPLSLVVWQDKIKAITGKVVDLT